MKTRASLSFAAVTSLALCLGACGRDVLMGPGEPDDPGDGGSGAQGTGASGTAGTGAAGAAGTGGTGATGASGTGASGATGTGGTAEVCTDLGDPCTECVAIQCPATWCGCVDNDGCFDLFQCFSACTGIPSCENLCFETYPDAISSVVLVSGCAGTTCSGTCTWGNPDFDDCSECAHTDCAAQMNACIASPACSALWTCFQDCSKLDLVCQQQCYDAYPEGVVPLQAAWQCIDDQCPEC